MSQPQFSAPSLLASVIAANTSCSLNNTLFVGNLHASLQEIDLIQVFRPFGRIVECCKKWLHFGFVKFTTEEEACHAYVTLNGFRLKGRPMRLEFQNRTKKARIKAILAQAALQVSSASVHDSASLANFGIFSSMHDERQANSSMHASGYKSYDLLAVASNDCSLFDADQLLKFASSSSDAGLGSFESSSLSSSSHYLENTLDLTESLFNLNSHMSEKAAANQHEQALHFNLNDEAFHTSTENTVSPLDSPPHDYSCSMSSSSGSGRRSNSFLAEEDSGICSIKSSKRSYADDKMSKQQQDDLKTASAVAAQELDSAEYKLNEIKTEDDMGSNNGDDDDDDEDDCRSSGDSDTSDDASDIPTDSDSLNDIDILEDTHNETESHDNAEMSLLKPSPPPASSSSFNQVINKDGSIVRKKLESGIYCSVNKTFTFFIEPQDVLKRVELSEYNEYTLFPSKEDLDCSSSQAIKNRL